MGISVKRRMLTLSTALAMAASMVVPALSAEPSPAPTASAPPKDPCATKTSKWQKVQCEEFEASAPGDEYFGRMKMSFLGINNTFRDQAIVAGDYTTNAGVINKVNLANDALHAWAAKYPNDPQLARSYFLGVAVYRKIYTQAAQQQAWAYIQLLLKHFPQSYFAKLLKTDLATRGFTEHWFADAQPCPVPTPEPTKGGKAVAVATSSPEPSPSPTPSAAPGQPNIDILTPPCVEPSP
jgi:hypothetical protein